MAETLVDFFINAFSADMSREVLVFIISLFPILELRGGILAGYALNMELLPSFVIAFIGNILPIPFVLLAIKAVFNYMKKTPLKNIAYFFDSGRK